MLLTPDMIAAMDLLMKSMKECQVHKENVYMFARPGVLSHYRGSDCFRKYAKQCGAKNPEALTSTRLRKQVATLSTLLNLKENEMDQLATFLGHDIRVHREFYRLPESTLQLAKYHSKKEDCLTCRGKGWMTLRSILKVTFYLKYSFLTTSNITIISVLSP